MTVPQTTVSRLSLKLTCVTRCTVDKNKSTPQIIMKSYKWFIFPWSFCCFTIYMLWFILTSKAAILISLSRVRFLRSVAETCLSFICHCRLGLIYGVCFGEKNTKFFPVRKQKTSIGLFKLSSLELVQMSRIG